MMEACPFQFEATCILLPRPQTTHTHVVFIPILLLATNTHVVLSQFYCYSVSHTHSCSFIPVLLLATHTHVVLSQFYC